MAVVEDMALKVRGPKRARRQMPKMRDLKFAFRVAKHVKSETRSSTPRISPTVGHRRRAR